MYEQYKSITHQKAYLRTLDKREIFEKMGKMLKASQFHKDETRKLICELQVSLMQEEIQRRRIYEIQSEKLFH